MVLFVSDMHFGAGDAASDRTDEADLRRCLAAQRAHASVDHLYLVGDVFDGYLEYRHLVPKGQVRLLGLLAEWADDGVPITYLRGNHDPWHRDYFEDEIGARVVDTVSTRHYGARVHVEHGDGVAASNGQRWALRSWLRHPVPVWLYRTLLPADAGIGLARWVSAVVRDSEVDPERVADLDAHAHRLLATTADVVVMGHTHVPILRAKATGEADEAVRSGAYLNTGPWFDARTFGRLDDTDDGPVLRLMRWNGTRAVSIEATVL